jgi:N6-adenosine-specific RNA methylase IME4
VASPGLLRNILPIEQAAARQRMSEGGKAAKVSTPSDAGKTRDKIGAFAGVSGRTVEKIAAVMDAAAESPARFAALAGEMDRTGKVDGAFRKLKQARDEQRVLAIKPVSGKYRTLVIDPPWDHKGFSLGGRGRPKYAVMSQDELLALPVAEWAEDSCHLYLWSTNNFIPHAVALMEAWGFAYKTMLTGIKDRFGLGSYFRSSTELVLFGVRGTMMTRARDIGTHFPFLTGAHSAKPENFYALVLRASYPPYGEVFQRKARADFASVFADVPATAQVSIPAIAPVLEGKRREVDALRAIGYLLQHA